MDNDGIKPIDIAMVNNHIVLIDYLIEKSEKLANFNELYI